MAKRTYSDEDRATALATLAANNDDLARTAADTGIPRKTLHNWSRGKGKCVGPAVANLGQVKKGQLADKLEEVAHRLADAIPGKIDAAPLSQCAVSLGIAVEKMRLLREQSTGNVAGTVQHSISLEDFRKLSTEEKIRFMRQEMGFAGRN